MPVFTDYPTTKQTSLNDILAPLANFQQYKQAQQLMPLELEAKQLELQKARETTPSEIERVKSLSREQLGKENPNIQNAIELAKQAKIQTQKDQLSYGKDYTQSINQVIGGFMNDPDLKSNDPLKVARVVKDAEDQVKYMTQEDPDGELKTEMRFAPIKNLIASGKHDKVGQVFSNLIQTGISPTSQQTLQTPQLTTVGGAPATFTPATGAATPLGINQTQQAGQQLGQQMGQQNAPQGVTPMQMNLQYPVRTAGDIRPLSPSEETDRANGQKYRSDLLNRQNNLATARRNLDEVIKDAEQISKEDLFSTGVLGAAERNIKGALGDEKYKRLSKAIANVQKANIQAQGGSMDTVAGQHLEKMASGDETYPPEVLKSIARQTYADVTNLDMQANAAQKFAQKYGDNNINTFKQMWAKNADSKVFEAINIFHQISDPKKRKEEIDKLLGDDKNARQDFYTKYKNIQKLEATGEL